MSVEESKPRFGGIPARAIHDHQLSGLDLRLLATIAAHDGFNKNRRGCFASHKRLAALTGAADKSVARCIVRLIEGGYIEAEGQSGDGRLRVYRVVYDKRDHAAFRGNGRSFAPKKPLAVVDDARSVGNRSVTECGASERSASETNGCSSRAPTQRIDPESVTDQSEIGNPNDRQFASNALSSNEKGDRIYSTKRNITLIDDPEGLSLCGKPIKQINSSKHRGSEHVEALREIISSAARHGQRTRSGPATDAEASIDQTIKGQCDCNDIVRLNSAPEAVRNSEAHPSRLLMDNAPYCKARTD